MKALFRKELNSFFSSLVGYVVVIIFLLVNSIFLWMIPENNLLDYGYADLSLFFENAPYIFLLLIPAITMRSFAEEKSTGNIEPLMIRPITEVKIIFAKYFAALVLVVFALIPTILYYISLYNLATPVGNIDTGAVLGSYIGLILLASVYVAIGIFASALTGNQIVSLLIAMGISLWMLEGFGLIGGLDIFKNINLFLIELGITSHYTSISRGVVDTRDVIYFLSVNAFFLLFTKTILQKRKW